MVSELSAPKLLVLDSAIVGGFRVNLHRIRDDIRTPPSYVVVLWNGPLHLRIENYDKLELAKAAFEDMKREAAVRVAKLALGIGLRLDIEAHGIRVTISGDDE